MRSTTTIEIIFNHLRSKMRAPMVGRRRRCLMNEWSGLVWSVVIEWWLIFYPFNRNGVGLSQSFSTPLRSSVGSLEWFGAHVQSKSAHSASKVRPESTGQSTFFNWKDFNKKRRKFFFSFKMMSSSNRERERERQGERGKNLIIKLADAWSFVLSISKEIDYTRELVGWVMRI